MDSGPTFFITFFPYRHHRPAPKSVRSSSDNAPSRSPPVSRDGRISGFEFFTALSQPMAPASPLAKARQIAKSHAKSNVLNILTITALLSSTSLILVGGVPPTFSQFILRQKQSSISESSPQEES